MAGELRSSPPRGTRSQFDPERFLNSDNARTLRQRCTMLTLFCEATNRSETPRIITYEDTVHRNVPRIAVAAAIVVVLAVVVFPLVRATGSREGCRGDGRDDPRVLGSVLVVDGGVLGGFPLYEFSGDSPGHFGCRTVKEEGYDLDPDARVTLTCTGPRTTF